MVRAAGVEPALLSELDFESDSIYNNYLFYNGTIIVLSIVC